MQLALATGHLDLGAGTLAVSNGDVRQLTEQERAILGYLVARPHEDVSRDALQSDVLGYADAVLSRAVDHAIKRIRAKIEPIPARPVHVVSVHGVGYRFIPLSSAGSSPLALSDRVVDLDRLQVRADHDAVVPLSATEGRLLEVLLAHEGRPVPAEELLRAVWDIYDRGRKRVVDKAVYRLRAKLEPDPARPVHLRTVRGKGLALEGVRRMAATRRGATTDDVDVTWVCPPPGRPLLGRDEDCARVCTALEPEGAWVTLIGAGGVGKSTLAQQVGSRWPHAASWTDLTGVTSHEGVLEALAAAHGVDIPAGEGAGPLAATVAHTPGVLLVLDNAEPAAHAVIATVLSVIQAVSPPPRVLVTTRQPLRAPREHVVPLGPLPSAAARHLFARSAERVGAPVQAEHPRTHEIVEQLGGMPLAIELAAARLPLLGLEGVSSRLHQPLRLLRSRAPADPRHASMETVWDLTWQDLPAAARLALAASAAFVGSFRLDALEFVLAGMSHDDPLESIQELTDRMLLVRHANGRLQLLVAIADFVRERAEDLQSTTRARRRALEWYARLGGPIVPGGEPAPEAYATLLPELDGALALVREEISEGWAASAARCLVWALPLLSRQGWRQRALGWAESARGLEALEPTLGLALAWRTAELLVLGGRRGDAAALIASRFAGEPDHPLTVAYALRAAEVWPEDRLARATALLEEVTGATAVVLCRGIAYAHEQQGLLQESLQLHRRALRFAEAADLPWRASDARRWLGHSLRDLGQAAEARPHLEQVVHVRAQAGLAPPTSYYGSMAGILALQGRFDEEAATLHEGVAAAQHRGDLVVAGWSEHMLAIALARQGDLDAAAEWFRRSRITYDRLGDRAGAAISLANLGESLRQLGHRAEAHQAWGEALHTSEGHDNPRVASMVLLSRGRMELEQGHLEAARRTLEAALTHSEGTDLLMYRVAHEVVYAEVLARLGDREALPRARRASALARETYRNDVLVQVLCHHAQAAVALDQLDEARGLLDEARTMADELGLKPAAAGRQMVQALAARLD